MPGLGEPGVLPNKDMKKIWIIGVLMIALCSMAGCANEVVNIALDPVGTLMEGEIYAPNSMEEFAELLKVKKPYTYDDVRRTIEENASIEAPWDDYFYQFTDEMEESFPELNLVCFYTNINGLEVVTLTAEEMEERFGDPSLQRKYSAEKTSYMKH